MARLVKMVRNSPLVTRKACGGYEVLDTENKDPFVKGITFNLHYFASAEVSDQQNTPHIQRIVGEVCKKSSKSLRKVILTVKAQSLTVTDVATNVSDSYPIFRVAYCGGHGEIIDSFFFIHKTRIDKSLRVEVFKCSSVDKVKAITLTIAKAFSISFKAWTLERKRKERENARGSESPALQRKTLAQVEKGVLGKIAPGVTAERTYTPPVLRRSTADETSPGRTRCGSFGDIPLPLKNSAVTRAMVHNEITGSTHSVILTDDFDKEFQLLAESRSQPEVLKTSFVEDTDHFSLESIKDHIDTEAEKTSVDGEEL